MRDVTGRERYPTLQNGVMASLVIAHGNADVERRLSDNKRVVSKERTKMSLDNIIRIRATQDAVRFYDPKNENAAKLPITLDGCSLLFGTRMLRTKPDWRYESKSLKRRSMPKRQLMLLTERNRDNRLLRRWHCKSKMKHW